MGLFQWYRSVAPQKRIYIGVGVMAWGCLGLLISDKAAEKWGLVPTDGDKKALKEALPKIITVEKR